MAAARRGVTGGLYVARDSFTVDLDGVPTTITKGITRVREGHPLLDGRESLFEPIAAHFEVDAPSVARGETRG